jgi:hypothetical protein
LSVVVELGGFQEQPGIRQGGQDARPGFDHRIAHLGEPVEAAEGDEAVGARRQG